MKKSNEMKKLLTDFENPASNPLLFCTSSSANERSALDNHTEGNSEEVFCKHLVSNFKEANRKLKIV
jgi:hypothetical protein